jgi:hypothetical protein
MIDPRVQSLCDEFGVTIIPATAYPQGRQTRAVKTVERIIRRHGESHMRLVMTVLVDTSNNAVLIDEVGLWAASDLVRAYADVVETDMSGFLEVWDQTPVGWLQWSVQRRLSGVVSQRAALVGLVHERLYKRFDTPQPELPLEDAR